MNKEQIQQKFDTFLKGMGFEFWTDEQLKKVGHPIKKDFEELMEFAFNLGLEVAADNAEADYTILSEDAEYLFGQMLPGQDYEVYCLKESILKHKL